MCYLLRKLSRWIKFKCVFWNRHIWKRFFELRVVLFPGVALNPNFELDQIGWKQSKGYYANNSKDSKIQKIHGPLGSSSQVRGNDKTKCLEKTLRKSLQYFWPKLSDSWPILTRYFTWVLKVSLWDFRQEKCRISTHCCRLCWWQLCFSLQILTITIGFDTRHECCYFNYNSHCVHRVQVFWNKRHTQKACELGWPYFSMDARQWYNLVGYSRRWNSDESTSHIYMYHTLQLSLSSVIQNNYR